MPFAAARSELGALEQVASARPEVRGDLDDGVKALVELAALNRPVIRAVHLGVRREALLRVAKTLAARANGLGERLILG